MNGKVWEQRPRKRKNQADYSKQMIAVNANLKL